MAVVVLYEGYQVIFEALDPVSGAAVAGVKVNNATITAEDLSLPIDGGPLDNLPPLFLPLPIDESEAA